MRPGLAIAISLSAFPLFAGSREELRPPTTAELQLKSTSLAPGASALVLDWIRRQDESSRWSLEYLRIKVLTEEGRKYANIEIPYLNRELGIDDLRARVIQPDGTIVPFAGTVYDKTLVRHDRIALMAKTFTLPDVHAGSIIEYTYTYHWREKAFVGVRWDVQRDIPVLHEYLWMHPAEGIVRTSVFQLQRGLPLGKSWKLDGCCFEMELENLEPVAEEPLSLPLPPRACLLYTGLTGSSEQYWDDMGRVLARFVDEFLGSPSALTSEVGRTIGTATSPDAKLHKLYTRAQQLRNVSYERSKSETEEKRERPCRINSALDVIRNGCGHRGDINRTFVAMARAAGFDANVIQVPDREEEPFSNKIPDGARLTAEIAEVVIDGKPRYFDPGTPFLPFGMLRWQNSSTAALRIANKQGTWIEIPPGVSDDATIVRTADLRLDGGMVKGRIVVRYSGLEAFERRFGFRNDDDGTARKALEKSAKHWFPADASVKLTSVAALRDVEEPLVVECDVELPALAANTGSRLVLPLSIFTSTEKNELSSVIRNTPVYLRYQRFGEDHVIFHVPGGYRVISTPPQAGRNLNAIAFDVRVETAGESVAMTRRVAVHAAFIDARHYSAVREFFDGLVAADRDAVVLQKSP